MVDVRLLDSHLHLGAHPRWTQNAKVLEVVEAGALELVQVVASPVSEMSVRARMNELKRGRSA